MTTIIATDRRVRRRLLAAEGYLTLEMPEHALRELRAIGDPGEDTFDFHCLKAEAYRSLGRWSDALAAFRVCHAEDPLNLEVLMGMAWCYKRIDQLSQAIATMHDAYQAHPKVPVVLYNLACYYALGGQKTRALSWLGRSLRMNPELRRLIPDETDFDPIRNSPEFQQLMALSSESASDSRDE